jgi:hypothetical protein
MSDRAPSGSLPLLHARGDLRHRDALALALLAALGVLLAYAAPPPLNLVVFAFLGVTILGALVWTWPLTMACGLPALIALPQLGPVFAFEIMLLVIAGVILAHGLWARRDWVWRLRPLEVAVAAMLLWGVITVFWCGSPWWWAAGIRRLVVGLVALWTAYRLGSVYRARWLALGIIAAAIALALAALQRGTSTDWIALTSSHGRREGTDLGWGGSNYIGALLLLTVPTALDLALRAPRRATRVLGWLILPLVVAVMAWAASRGGALLVVMATLLFVFRERLGARSVALIGAIVLCFVALLAGPGAQLLWRFTDPGQIGSVVVRLVFFQEGWRRLVEHFPIGLGLGQGFVQLDRLAEADPHNYLLVVGSELGLPGLLLWGLIIALIWRQVRELAKMPAVRAGAEALRFTLIVAVVNSLYEPTFTGLHYLFLFYWIVGAYLGSLSAAGATDLPRAT